MKFNLAGLLLLSFLVFLIYCISLLLLKFLKKMNIEAANKLFVKLLERKTTFNQFNIRMDVFFVMISIWLIISYYVPNILGNCTELYLSGDFDPPPIFDLLSPIIGRRDSVILLLGYVFLLGGTLIPIFLIYCLIKFTFNSKANSNKRVTFVLVTYIYILFAFAGEYTINYYNSDMNDIFNKEEIYWKLRKVEMHKSLDKYDHYNKATAPEYYRGLFEKQDLSFKDIQKRFWIVSSLNVDNTRFSDRVKFESSNKIEIYKEFLYYSGVTLTTLGYGDILPTHSSSRLLAIFEAVIGQLLLVLGFVNITKKDK